MTGDGKRRFREQDIFDISHLGKARIDCMHGSRMFDVVSVHNVISSLYFCNHLNRDGDVKMVK